MVESHSDGDARLLREQKFLEALPTIEATLRFVGRRHRLSTEDLEDFASEVKLAFIEKDYAVLTRFEGRSSLKTYLVTVIQRLFLDRQRRHWGKWRPSAEAKRLGATALRLEQLLYRDAMSVDEACETLRTNHAVDEPPETLRALAQRLPARTSRKVEAMDADDGHEIAAPLHLTPLANLQAGHTATMCQAAIEESMGGLPPEDRVVLRLRFEDDISVADISRSLSLDQKRLYKRIETMMAQFREHMESKGLAWAEVATMIERGQCHLRLPFEICRENVDARPSPEVATP